MSLSLADRIEVRIREIPASNPGYVSAFAGETLGNVLSRDLLRKIAETAAKEAQAFSS